MLTQSPYRILATLSENGKTAVYRAQRPSDQTPLIIKTPASPYPTTSDIARLRYEQDLLQSLTIHGVIQSYGLDEATGHPLLLLEDLGGRDLSYWQQQEKFSIEQVLWIGQQVAIALRQLHQQQVIHKDIKPANIVLNPETQVLKLIDFSIASRLSHENPNVGSPNTLEGTLAYLSPEQTGRMNRTIDYRSDFYSLGVTLYELLTGQLPFTASDPMELVHCHLARLPHPPHHLNTDIPETLSAIILKLMAKEAEDRYQSSNGLQADLEYCLQEWQAQKTIHPFPLAQKDQQGIFLIPQKLYGREAQVKQLLAAFERVSQGTTELLLVAGYSGIGKSALVKEIQKPITRQRGYFISGKFDQFQRNIPYSCLIQAFRELVRQLLTEPEAQIQNWRAKLLAALGSNASVIVEVIPEIELILGEQPPVSPLPITEAQNRFNLVFRAFINVFTQPEHPLVIFLDDLQWADPASLQLIQVLVTDPDRHYLLMIGAYRDNEVSPTHSLMQTLATLTAEGAALETLTLTPLSLADTAALVSDTLQQPRAAIEPLANLLLTKTNGNPFFLTQLFKYLEAEALIQFDLDQGQWVWNLSELLQIEITENVVELMVHEIQRLSDSTQAVLCLAACVGNQFDLSLLAAVHQASTQATATNLWDALQAGLVVPLSEAYQVPEMVEDCEDLVITYKFLHDRVQQAAYSLIPENQKQQVHLKVGRSLLENTPLEEREDRLFDIVNALNLGADLLHGDRPQQLELARLNFQAARKAKASAAYAAALTYLRQGRALLPEDAWQTEYDLTLALYIEAVEVESIQTQFETADALAEVVLREAQDLLDKVKIYELKIQFLIAQNQMLAAIEMALPVLELLGCPLELDPALLPLVRPLPTLAELPDYPEMRDPYQLAAMQILTIVSGPAYQAKPELLPFIISRLKNMSLESGHSSLAAYAYGTVNIPFGSLDQVYHSGQVSLRVLEQYPSDALKCKIYMLFSSFVVHWKEPHRQTIKPLDHAIQVGLETGDLVYAAYAAMWACGYLLFMGIPLVEVAEKQNLYLELLTKIKQDHGLYPAKTWRQLSQNLQNEAPDSDCLAGDFLTPELVAAIEASGNQMLMFFVYFAEMLLAYVLKDWAKAQAKMAKAAPYAIAAFASMLFGYYPFYETLVQCALYPDLDPETQAATWTEIERKTAQTADWARYAPHNFQSKYELMRAEQARLQGQVLEAMEYYDRAIDTAQGYGFLAEVAIATERAAELYYSLGRERIAQQYWLEALYRYERWGATAKVTALEAALPSLHQAISPVSSTRSTQPTARSSQGGYAGQITHTENTTGGGSQSLDLHTVIKAAQALSGQIVLPQLLSQLMSLALENAGAQQGYLLLLEQDHLVVAASGKIDETTAVSIEMNQPLTASSPLPLSLIQYVQRTQESIVLGNAAQAGLFINDPHIIKGPVRSVICVPILNQGRLLGILYLENNRVVDVFTDDRLEILKILSSQATISIENALLYRRLETYNTTLEAKVEERTEALGRKNQDLQIALQTLQETQAQLIQAEKMSSLGQMVAGIAHEINNPIGFISGNIDHAQVYMQDLRRLIDAYQREVPTPSVDLEAVLEEVDLAFIDQDTVNLFESMKTGSERIRQIVLSLRNFSRLDESDRKQVDIHEGLDNTLLILQHRLKAEGDRPAITLEKHYEPLPRVTCIPSQLNQVFLNILTNAIDALRAVGEDNPTIQITTTALDRERVQIRIADNGPGMEAAVQEKMFDPFFTTKPVGKGTGLGLSISYQIVTEQHGGQLICQSELGHGTELVIEIPV